MNGGTVPVGGIVQDGIRVDVDVTVGGVPEGVAPPANPPLLLAALAGAVLSVVRNATTRLRPIINPINPEIEMIRLALFIAPPHDNVTQMPGRLSLIHI